MRMYCLQRPKMLDAYTETPDFPMSDKFLLSPNAQTSSITAISALSPRRTRTSVTTRQ